MIRMIKTKIFSITEKMKDEILYYVIWGNYKKFEKSKI